MGDIVFTDPAALRQLEAITHPAVRQRIDELVARRRADCSRHRSHQAAGRRAAKAVDVVWVVDARRLANWRACSSSGA